MNRLPVAVAFVFASFLAACSGAPPQDSPDYELTSSPSRGSSGGGSSTSGGEPSESETEEEVEESSSSSSSGGSSSSSGGSSSGGMTSSSSSGGTSSGNPPPPADTVTVKVDGSTLKVEGTRVWSEVSGPGEYHLFIDVTGIGAATGSDFSLSATKTGSGCDNQGNFITFRPQGDAQFMPRSTNDANCGLVMEEIPKPKSVGGGRYRGHFRGTLRSINETPARTKQFDLEFDVAAKPK